MRRAEGGGVNSAEKAREAPATAAPTYSCQEDASVAPSSVEKHTKNHSRGRWVQCCFRFVCLCFLLSQ